MLSLCDFFINKKDKKKIIEKGVKVDTSEMSDKKFPEALVGPKTGNGVVLQLTGWKEGPFDTSYDGCERLCEKYTQNPKLKLVAGNQLKK
mgnify:CR=1 FL=1